MWVAAAQPGKGFVAMDARRVAYEHSVVPEPKRVSPPTSFASRQCESRLPSTAILQLEAQVYSHVARFLS